MLVDDFVEPGLDDEKHSPMEAAVVLRDVATNFMPAGLAGWL